MGLSLNEQHDFYERFTKNNPEDKPFESMFGEEFPVTQIYINIMSNKPDRYVILDAYFNEDIAMAELSSLNHGRSHIIGTETFNLMKRRKDRTDYRGIINPFTREDKKMIFEMLERRVAIGSCKYDEIMPIIKELKKVEIPDHADKWFNRMDQYNKKL